MIDSPDCKRFNKVEDKYTFITDKILSIIKNMKLCSMKLIRQRKINTNYKFCQKVETVSDKFHIINYITKQDKELKNFKKSTKNNFVPIYFEH